MKRALVTGLALFLPVWLSGCSRTEPTTAGGKPVTYWLSALHNSDVHARKKAVQKLGNVGAAEPAVLPALVGMLKDPDSTVRCEAILALTKLGPAAKGAEEALSNAKRNDRDARVRGHATKAMAKLRGEN
jgi:HEAT repeat protein